MALATALALPMQACDESGREQAIRIDKIAVSEAPVSGLPSDILWYRTDYGWIITRSRSAVSGKAREMQAAVQGFEKGFAPFEGTGGVIDLDLADHIQRVRDAGFLWVMHWRNDGKVGVGAHALLPKETLRHEIGHLLFMAAVWGNSLGAQYGGDAPDWLDETAAILVEDAETTRGRRRSFERMLTTGRVIPMAEYSEMIHPLYASESFQALLASKSDKSERGGYRYFALSKDQLHGLEANLSDFYAQTRGFIDYLLARTGNERVFLEIAGHLKAGGTMAGWLKTGETPQKSGLPPTIAALDADFRAFSHEVAGLSDAE